MTLACLFPPTKWIIPKISREILTGAFGTSSWICVTVSSQCFSDETRILFRMQRLFSADPRDYHSLFFRLNKRTNSSMKNTTQINIVFCSITQITTITPSAPEAKPPSLLHTQHILLLPSTYLSAPQAVYLSVCSPFCLCVHTPTMRPFARIIQ